MLLVGLYRAAGIVEVVTAAFGSGAMTIMEDFMDKMLFKLLALSDSSAVVVYSL